MLFLPDFCTSLCCDLLKIVYDFFFCKRIFRALLNGFFRDLTHPFCEFWREFIDLFHGKIVITLVQHSTDSTHILLLGGELLISFEREFIGFTELFRNALFDFGKRNMQI